MKLKYTYAVLALVSICVCLRVIGFYGVQAASCPTPRTPDHHGPVQSRTYSYYLSPMSSLTRGPMRDAFSTWTTHNSTNNCTRVVFTEVTGPTPAVQGATDIFCLTANPLPAGVGAAAAGYYNCQQSNPNLCLGGYIQPNYCRIWLKYPAVNANDPINSTGNYFPTFASAVRKFGSHEIGHIMGLGHQPAPEIQHYSIMNNGIGINDAGNGSTPSVSAGNLPWNPIAPTNCDNTAFQCWTCATPTPTPSPGVNCYWTSTSEYVLIGTCWYIWTRHYYICNGAIYDYWDEWTLDYCEAQ
jgi:hypothetical protein